MLAAYSMYIIGVVVAILIALVISKIDSKRETNTLLIELPEYKAPNRKTIIIYVWEKVKDYLTKAGTTIFVASIILWILMNFGTHGMVNDITDSFAAVVGKGLVPIMSFAGLGHWEIIVSLISGIAAKEVVVSSMSVLYGIGNISSNEGMGSLVEILSNQGFGIINAYSMMLFTLLYVPCAATIGIIKRETKSFKMTLFAVMLQLSTAWIISTLFFQIATGIANLF